MIQYSAAPVIDVIGHGVLDARFRGHDDGIGLRFQATSDSFETRATMERLRPPALAA